MSDMQYDQPSVSECDTSTPESGLVTPAIIPVLPSTFNSRRKAAAAFLDLSTQSQADQMEVVISSDSNPRQDPRSVRPPWYDPANYPLRQPSRHHATRNSHESTDEEGNPLSLRWWSQHSRLREDRDGNLRLWNGEMRGNRRVYRLHRWAGRVYEKGGRSLRLLEEGINMGALSRETTLQIKGGIMRENLYTVLICGTHVLCRGRRQRRRETRPRIRMRMRVMGRFRRRRKMMA